MWYGVGKYGRRGVVRRCVRWCGVRCEGCGQKLLGWWDVGGVWWCEEVVGGCGVVCEGAGDVFGVW